MNKSIKIFIFLLLVLYSASSEAQTKYGLKKLFYDAEYFLMSEDYRQALDSYFRIYTEENNNANINYRIGLCFMNIPGEKLKSIPYLEFAANYISKRYSEGSFREKDAPFHTLFLLGSAYQIKNDFQKAVRYFTEYKSHLKVKDVYTIDYIEKQIKSCELAIKYINDPLNVSTRILDDIIPQEKPNFNAIRSANGEVMIYMTREKFYNAIWMIRKEGETWDTPVNITPQIESDGDCYPTSINGEGTELYMVIMNNFGANICSSRFEDGRWSPKQKLDKPINSRFWETHACITPDGKTLYFTSDRLGGFGSTDIYKSNKSAYGSWGEPENLGSVINTPYSEETPFLLDKGKILYFSSQGHQGMGGFDIFKSELQAGNEWSEPINLSYPLNTTDDDLFFFPLEDEKKFLYSGLVYDTDESNSIKEIVINPVSSLETIALNGIITTEDSDELSKNTKVILNLINSNKTDTISPDLGSNSFSINLQPGTYELLAYSDGYADAKKIISIPADYQKKEFNVSVSLTPDEVASGEYYAIKSILFDFDSYELNRYSKLEIERLYNVMIRYPELYIEVTGHTDSKGSPTYNLQLSKKRANVVVNYLVNRGIDPMRFYSLGVGETQNLALNTNPDGSDNPDGRQINRSVSVKILNSPDQNITIEPAPVPDYLKPPMASTYTIYLKSSVIKIDNESFDALRSVTMDNVNEMHHKSVYIYSLGRFFSESQAKEVLSTQPFKEFPLAKVVQLDELKAYTGPSSIMSGFSGQFSLQLYALKNSVTKEKFPDLEDIKIVECTDGLFRVLKYSFDTYEEARKMLPKIREQGYTDAFIVNVSKLNILETNL